MLGSLLNSLADIISPKTCITCKDKLKGKTAVDEVICLPCWDKIKVNKPPFCRACGRHLGKNNFLKHFCPECLKRKLEFDRAFSPCVYEGAVKNLIHEFKYNNKDHLAATLAKPMISFIKEYQLPMDYLDLIVPIPLHKTKLREREFNQAELLSNIIAKEFNKKILPQALERNRITKTQTELAVNERISNVKGAFSLAKEANLKNKNILLVDDVLTTGATCSEAASVLKDNGANIVFVLTLAN